MMKEIYLDKNLTLSVESLGKSVRLVILEGGKELVCRKETVKKMHDFLSTDQLQVFKGRLQLLKTGDRIDVIVKKIPVGIISLAQLQGALYS